MALHLCRDYLSQNTTTANRVYISSYIVSMFLRRVLGYSYVGDTNFNINAVGQYLFATGDTTPTSTPTFSVGNKAGIANNVSAIEVAIPVGVRGVIPSDVGRMLILKSSLYPTRNSGVFLINALQQGNTTTVAAASNNVALPIGTINVASTTGFPTSGTFFIGPNTTIASGSNGANIATAGTINVASTTGFPTSGQLHMLSTNGVQTVTYTNTTGTTFTGCTGGTGTLFTGGTVFSVNDIQTITYNGTTATQFQNCSGGTGTLITGEPIYNQNKFVIDYRGNGELSLPEAADTIAWYLYDKDINCPGVGANNTASASQYRGSGNSTTPRIILQSPHATNWQIRICNEAPQDFSVNFNTDVITFCPGFGGNASGDFSVGGNHLHGAQFYDTSIAGYNTCTGVGDNAGANGAQYRYTMIGDDAGQSFTCVARRPLNATSPESFLITFGIPDNEPAPLPVNNTDRLYALGNGAGNNVGNGRMNQCALSVGSYVNSNRIQGATFHLAPISCSPALWCYLTSNAQQASPMYDASAGDSPFTSATELLPVDLVGGVVHTWNDVDNTVRLPYYPRVIGTLPFIRAGRTNFGDYTLTTDANTWTANAATNASPIQITTTTTNTLVTGQTVAINGATGNTAANGTFTVTVINNTTFTLDGTTGNGTFSGTATVVRGAAYQHMRFGTYLPWNGPAVVP